MPVVVGLPLYVRSLAGLSGGRRWTALVTRSLVMALLILCLAGLQWTQTSKSVSVVYLLDRSDSVPQNLKDAELAFVHETKKRMKEDDRAGMITFGGRSTIEQVPIEGDYGSAYCIKALAGRLRPADRQEPGQARTDQYRRGDPHGCRRLPAGHR